MSLQGGARRAGVALSLGLALMLAGGCRNKTAGELRAPEGAAAWDSRFGPYFDDRFTPSSIELAGRAAGDVRDQQLFMRRLGHANLVVLVTVDQVWSRTLLGGAPQQRAEITLGTVLLGKAPKKTATQQTLILRAAEELPTDAVGRVMLLFVRWAPGDAPAYHHHLMPADAAALALIDAMVRHAREAGKLDDEGPLRKRRKKGSGEST